MVTAEALADRWGLLIVMARARLQGYDPCDWEDVAATALLRAWSSRHTFTPKADGSGLNEWLGTIVANAAIDHWRKTRLRQHQTISDEALQFGTTDAGNDAHLTMLDVRAALALVPAETQAYLQLRQDGFAPLEAVHELGLAKSRSYGARKSVSFRVAHKAADQLGRAMGMGTVSTTEIDGQGSCASQRLPLPDAIRAARPLGEDRPQPSTATQQPAYPPAAAWPGLSRHDLRRYRQGATRLGISLDEYVSKIRAGLKWCCGHARWCDRRLFGPHMRYPDGLDSQCAEISRQRSREYQRRKRAAERREGGA